MKIKLWKFLAVFFALFLLSGALAEEASDSEATALETEDGEVLIIEEFDEEVSREDQTAEENTQVHHYLLLGEDGYSEELTDDARTDTIVLVTLDEKYNRVLVTSILRDSRINTPRGNTAKINTIYKMYGFDGIISCLERELDIHIEGAVLVNFNNVKPVIDALGGVDIEIDVNEYISIKKILLNKDPNMPKGPGLVHMTGRIALAYMRDRKSGSGDFGRTSHQREVLRQLFEKCRALPLSDLINIYNEVSGGLETSLSPLAILSAVSSGYGLIQKNAVFAEFRIPSGKTYSYGNLNSSSTLVVNWKRNKEKFHALLDTPPEE